MDTDMATNGEATPAKPAATDYILVVHADPSSTGLPVYVALSAHATSQAALRAIRDRANVVDVSGEVYSVLRRVYPTRGEGITAAPVQRVSVKLSGLGEPRRQRKPRAAAAIEKVRKRARGSKESQNESASV